MADRWENEVDDALRCLRDDVPAMDPRAFAAGRARLLAHLGAPPVAEVTASPNSTVVRALPSVRLRRSPPPRRATPWLAVATAVAAVTVGTVALRPGASAPGDWIGPGPSTTSTTAPSTPQPPPKPGEPLPPMPAAPLNPAGDLAGKAADLPLGPGQVHYVRSVRNQAASAAGPGGSGTFEYWIPFDRKGEWALTITATGTMKGRSGREVEEKRAQGGLFDLPDRLPWTPQSTAALPRDPARLYEWLQKQADALRSVFSLLGDPTGSVPADLRAALLRTLGYLPGVTVTSGVTASDGRPATMLRWVVDGRYRNELLLDPATARPVELREVAVTAVDGLSPGQVFTSDLRTESVVAEMGRKP